MSPFGNCKCGFRLYFKSGPNKNGSYTFTCYECGANTNRSVMPAQFESEYVDRLIRQGDLLAALCDAEVRSNDVINGWRALAAQRTKEEEEGV